MKLCMANDIQLSNMSKKVFNGRKKLDEQTIFSAIAGDTLALMKIIDIYEPYINRLSIRVTIDENGQYKEEIDETVKRTLETSLIAAIMRFDPANKKSNA